MMKVTLLLVLAYLAVALAGRAESSSLNKHSLRKGYGAKCQKLSCVKDNEECGITDLGNDLHTTQCFNYYESHCNYTETGSQYSKGTCLRALTVNQDCTNGVCAVGLSCELSNRTDSNGNFILTCQNDPIDLLGSRPGQPCGVNEDCRFESFTDGEIENVCNNKVCKYLNDGQECNSRSMQCNAMTSTCYADEGATVSTCRSYVALGGRCNTTTRDNSNPFPITPATYLLQCQGDNVCVPDAVDTYSGVCMEQYTQKENRACIEDYDCKEGLCALKTNNNYYYGVCTNFRKTSTLNKPCIGDDDCTSSNGERCQCNSDGESKCVNTDLGREFKDSEYEECSIDNRASCYRSSANSAEYDKCIAQACKKHICKQYNKYKNKFGDEAPSSPSQPFSDCEMVYWCDAPTLLASLPFLALATAFVMLFQ